MCKCYDYNSKIHNEEHPDQAFPKVLLALIRLERKAQKEINSIEDALFHAQEMNTILTKLTTTHIDSDNYANYLFKRAEQLSSHLESYKSIVGKIDIGSDVQINYNKMSRKFVDYLREKIEFKTIWIDCMQTIDVGKKTIDEKLIVLNELKKIAEQTYTNKNYFDLSDIKLKCDEELNVMNELMEMCLASGKRCKEFGGRLYNLLTELETCFHDVVHLSMKRITKMKRIPAVTCNN